MCGSVKGIVTLYSRRQPYVTLSLLSTANSTALPGQAAPGGQNVIGGLWTFKSGSWLTLCPMSPRIA